MKKYSFLIISLLFIQGFVFSQGNFNMGSTRNVSAGCGAFIFDNGGTGNYGANRNDTITIYSNNPLLPFVKVTIEEMNIDVSDTMYIYNSNTADPAKIVYIGGISAPWINDSNPIILGDWATFATIDNPSGAITIRFKSNGTTQGAGFKLSCECITACQRINGMINPTASVPPLVLEDGFLYANVCQYQTATFTGYGDYIDNDVAYHQSDDSTYFSWNLGDTTISGWGLSTVTHYYIPGRGYDVVLFLSDQRSCVNQNAAILRVRTSKNPITNIAPLPDVCSGTNIDLSVGYGSGSNVIVAPITSEQQSSLSFDSTMFVPDGPNCAGMPTCYNTNVTFTSFLPNQQVATLNDIVSICFTMEHSYLGDLQFRVVCPNGQSTITHAQPNGGGLYLGVPVDDSGGCTANPSSRGTGWNYCWSQNTTMGFGYHGSAPNYLHLGQGTRCDSTNRTANTNYYKPMNSFASLIGCPLNGVWSIEICDLYGIDDGWIFGWTLNLDPSLLPTPWSYTVLVEEVLWSGPLITPTSDTTAVIETPDAGAFDYTFSVIDEYGCAYDSTFTLNVVQSPQFDLGADVNICSGALVQVDPQYNTPGAVYSWSDGTNDALLTTTVPGNYCLTITQSNGNITCQSNDCVSIVINPQPVAEFSAAPTQGCSPLWVQFTDLSTPSGIPFTYYWDFGDPYTSQNTSNEQNPFHIYENYGTYDVTLRIVTDAGCESEIVKTGMIQVYATPVANFLANPETVSLSDNPDVYFQNLTQNFIPGQTYWDWSFGDGGTSDLFDPTHTYSHPQDYIVTLGVTTSHGCGDTISKIIIVEDEIFIPNIITPDGDGVNDVLVIGNINPQRINTLKIFNRWGKKVYDFTNYKPRAECEKNADGITWTCSDFQDLSLGWGGDGNADGVYFYTFVYSGVTKEVVKHGSITIIGKK